MLRRCVIVVSVVGVVLFGSGCSGTDDGGGSGGDGTGPDDGNLVLVGTCYGAAESSDGSPACQEIWVSPAAAEATREDQENNCESDPGDWWKDSKEACPTDQGYTGTCVTETRVSYQEVYYYGNSAKSGCEASGGEWVVE